MTQNLKKNSYDFKVTKSFIEVVNYLTILIF